jgi:hypothetical protein
MVFSNSQMACSLGDPISTPEGIGTTLELGSESTLEVVPEALATVAASSAFEVEVVTSSLAVLTAAVVEALIALEVDDLTLTLAPAAWNKDLKGIILERERKAINQHGLCAEQHKNVVRVEE